MKKRVLGAIMAAVILVSQAFTVFAADSKTAGVSPAGDSKGYYTVTEGTEQSFSYLNGDVRSQILAVNGGTASLESLSPDVKAALGGKRMITDFFNLSAENGGVKAEDGKYLVSLEVTSITSSMTGIQILYYNTATGAWSVIAPSDVSYEDQIITFTIDQLPAPVCVIADKGTAVEDNKEGTSPQTGTVSGWMLWMGAAVVLAGVSLAAYKKSGNK